MPIVNDIPRIVAELDDDLVELAYPALKDLRRTWPRRPSTPGHSATTPTAATSPLVPVLHFTMPVRGDG
jgi:hypothetical protein